jgi:hypothetical protein
MAALPMPSGRYVSFIQSLPCFKTGFIPKIERCTADAPFIAAPDAAISSSSTDACVVPRPPPP